MCLCQTLLLKGRESLETVDGGCLVEYEENANCMNIQNNFYEPTVCVYLVLYSICNDILLEQTLVHPLCYHVRYVRSHIEYAVTVFSEDHGYR